MRGALHAAREAAADMPAEPRIQFALAEQCARFGFLEKGREAWERAVLLAPGAERSAARRETFLHLAALDPTGSGRGEKILAFCDLLLRDDPGNTEATYLRAATLAQLGRDDEARAAMPLDRLVAIGDLPAPQGYPDGDSFRAALRCEILRNPTLQPDPHSTATSGGLQTARLVQPGNTALPALLAAIRDAVDGYARGLALATRPAAARLDSWAVVYAEQGRQEPHRHPDGWLSGVYYVNASRGQDGAFLGALVLGMFEEEGAGAPPWGTTRIEPRPGRLVLFPSFVPHATEPAESAGERICVAFDVAPTR
jgi:hypothetical protein